MIDWKAINRRLKEILSKDGYTNLGTISISYDDNCASLISSLTKTDIFIKLYNDNNYGKVYLEIDDDAADKNKKIFKKLIDDKDLMHSLMKNHGMLFDKVSQEKVLMYESENTINEEYYVDKVIIIFEKIWPILLDKKIEKEKRQQNLSTQINEIKEEKQPNVANDSNEKTNTNTIIRLISKENNIDGITYRFKINNDDYHDLEIQIIEGDGPIESVAVNIKSKFDYFIPTKINDTKFIIIEKEKKLYQCRIIGNHSSKKKTFESISIVKEIEKEEKTEDEKNGTHSTSTSEAKNEFEKTNIAQYKTIFDKEFSFNHEEIFNTAMKILN